MGPEKMSLLRKKFSRATNKKNEKETQIFRSGIPCLVAHGISTSHANLVYTRNIKGLVMPAFSEGITLSDISKQTKEPKQRELIIPISE